MRAALALLAACHVSVDYSQTQYQCPDGVCPSGFSCVAGACVHPVEIDAATDATDAAPSCVSALYVNQEFTCAELTASGAMMCWGRGGNGEFGNGQTLDTPTPAQV